VSAVARQPRKPRAPRKPRTVNTHKRRQRPAEREDPLLRYVEALRTGQDLGWARQRRDRLKRQHPGLIGSLEDEMPAQHVETVRKPAPTRRERQRTSRAIRDGLAPKQGHITHLRHLERELGRKPYEPPNRKAAVAEINRLTEVRKTLRRLYAESEDDPAGCEL
jgi:hypothetical protein